jgi:two-component system sensor histidine kinase DesK
MVGDAFNTRRSALLWCLLWLVFLPFGIPLLVELAQSHPAPWRLLVSLIGVVAFIGLYVWAAYLNARELASSTPPEVESFLRLWCPILALGVAAWLLAAINGPVWGALFIFTGAIAAGRLPLRGVLFVFGAIVMVTVLGGARAGMSAGDIAQAVLTLGITVAATLAVVQSVRAAQLLRTQREEMARHAAVAEERLRIARDLHDLLGHNLSVIALKSELARRLAPGAPERAAVEIGEVEQVARRALLEVREAVTGYRQPALAGELASARDLLEAAGVRYRLIEGGHAVLNVPPAVDAALGWALREGITNVLRHSAARECMLRLSRNVHEVAVELINDGVTADVSHSDADYGSKGLALRNGNGLRGLSERAQALGGEIEVGPFDETRFRLYMRIPLAQVVAERAADALSDGAPPVGPRQPPSVSAPVIELLEQAEEEP